MRAMQASVVLVGVLASCARASNEEELIGTVDEDVRARATVLIRQLEADYAAAPECGTLRIGVMAQLVGLGDSARSVVEDACQESPVREELESWVLDRLDAQEAQAGERGRRTQDSDGVLNVAR